MEQATLIEVKNDGQTLVLADGRELNVDHRSATPDTVRFALSSEMDTDHAARLQGLLANAPLRGVSR